MASVVGHHIASGLALTLNLSTIYPLCVLFVLAISKMYDLQKEEMRYPASNGYCTQAVPAGISKSRNYLVVLLCLLSLLLISGPGNIDFTGIAKPYVVQRHRQYKGNVCPQSEPLIPSTDNALWKNLSEYYATDSFLEQAVDWLGGAVRIP